MPSIKREQTKIIIPIQLWEMKAIVIKVAPNPPIMNNKETTSQGIRSNGLSFRKAAIRSKIAEIIPAATYTIEHPIIAGNF